jgi:hypothetical protein
MEKEREREKKRETERERERQRETKSDRNRDRERGGTERGGQTNKQKDRTDRFHNVGNLGGILIRINKLMIKGHC